MRAIHSLAHFTKLRKLEIAYEALVNEYRPSPLKILPASLEHLVVLAPSIRIVTLLEDLVRESSFLKLHTVEIVISTFRGARHEEFDRPIWDQLAAANIRIIITQEEEDCVHPVYESLD